MAESIPPSTTAPPPENSYPAILESESPVQVAETETSVPKESESPVPEEESPAKVESETTPEPLVATTAVQVEEHTESQTITESEDTQIKEPKKSSFIQSAVSFKVESNLLSDLSDFERKSLEDFKTQLKQSLSDKTLLPKSSKSATSSASNTIESALNEEDEKNPDENDGEVSIWGIPLLKDDRTDVILLKFLRARDFRVNDAFSMLKNTLIWRENFGIDKLVDEDLGDALEKVVFMHGHDREGHPVCYNVYGEFQNKDLYAKTFSSEEKREKFLKWRIQFLEKSIRKLDFDAGGVNTIFQVNDLKNAPGPGKRDLRLATRQALHLLQDNYPEFVAKQVFINVPWWYLAFYTMMSPFMTQRTKSKFVFAGPSKTAETLFKYVSPEQVPIQYGGLSVDYCDCNPDFTVDDPATVLNLKTATKQFVEIICSEKCIIVWELRVVGWDITYSAEFVPSAENSYIVVIQKSTKMTSSDDPVISGSFKVGEIGKIVLTVDNPTFKRKKLLYRYKVLPFSD
ncbi:patellin-3-like [Chenopodium quinoa]|uniref:CRAL-TRIO domain-containing protein n=1 Tax=Chenopodium quinoa TaxID=63459 RepID=A0A803KZZ2_CHEQI|nr:patellin-3-like [Chenopodium quinoa]